LTSRVLHIINSYVRSKQWSLVLSWSAEPSMRKCHKKKTSVVEKQLRFLHHDNAPAHVSLLIHDFLANMNTTVLPQPSHSPNLTPAVFLFPTLKSTLKERFKRLWKIRRRSYTRSRKGCTRTVSTVVTALGAVHQCRRGELWRR
jgi:hypothetical protein